MRAFGARERALGFFDRFSGAGAEGEAAREVILRFVEGPGGRPAARLADGREVVLDPSAPHRVRAGEAWTCSVVGADGRLVATPLRNVGAGAPPAARGGEAMPAWAEYHEARLTNLEAAVDVARLAADVLALRERLERAEAELATLRERGASVAPGDPAVERLRKFTEDARSRGLAVASVAPDGPTGVCVVRGCGAASAGLLPAIVLTGDEEPSVAPAEACAAHAAAPPVVVELRASVVPENVPAAVRALGRAGRRLGLARPLGLASDVVQVGGPAETVRVWDSVVRAMLAR